MNKLQAAYDAGYKTGLGTKALSDNPELAEIEDHVNSAISLFKKWSKANGNHPLMEKLSDTMETIKNNIITLDEMYG